MIKIIAYINRTTELPMIMYIISDYSFDYNKMYIFYIKYYYHSVIKIKIDNII